MATKKIILVILVMILLTLACSLPGQNGPGEELPAATTEPQAEVIVTEEAQPQPEAVEPSLTPEIVQSAVPDVSCNGLSLSYDDTLATGATCTITPASPGGADYPAWDIYPEYRQIYFDGYLLPNTFHNPGLHVYPIAEYENMNEQAAGIIANLRQLLAHPSNNPDSLPFLPSFNAAQMIRSNILYLDFQNGSGVRFLTQYGQAAYPINNNSLFYTFQGISSDGQYYVALILPVNHPSLPATGDTVPNGDWDAFYETFDSYVADMQMELNAQPASSFVPNLDLLDELARSIRVE